MSPSLIRAAAFSLIVFLSDAGTAQAQVAIRGKTIHTMAGVTISNGAIVIRDGKISAIGKVEEITIPDGFRVLEGEVVVPGIIDAHATMGVSGILNYEHDQDQLEHAVPVQPELRALDAYNAHDPLVEWARGYGITTVHTGHAPGELISGQTMIVKTSGNTVEQAVISPARCVAVTLADAARKSASASPGTRGKMVAMLRAEFVRAREYLERQKRHQESSQGTKEGTTGGTPPSDGSVTPPERDLRLETLGKVLEGELVLLVTADRAQDIANAIRLAEEFSIKIWLDSASEAYLLLNEIKQAGIPVLVHPSMARAVGERENLTFENAAKLVQAGIPVALQSGYESYVPKTRIVLFEAGIAAAHGLPWDAALRAVTMDAAKILGIADRVGSLEVGKDGDVAIYDGDPFEYTTHCTGVVINGQVVSSEPH
jgi:imidazolonepropionase-like amidohydrolase